jgi:hypothetical protein
VHSQQHSKRPHVHDRHRQTKQHNQDLYRNPCSSVGTRMPARNPIPLDFARIPKNAQYIEKNPLNSPTVSLRKAPATRDARSTPPGPAASLPRACMSFNAGWPKHPQLSTLYTCLCKTRRHYFVLKLQSCFACEIVLHAPRCLCTE